MPAGTPCWMSPSASGVPDCSAASLPAWIRWMQRLHFSMTPRERTTTSGLSTIVPSGLFMWKSNRGLSRVLEPVEPPHLVRAVVLAVARADAAVVDLLVDAVGAVHGRQNRADRFARRVVAVLAHHRLEDRVRARLGAAVVAIDADPVHLPAAPDFVLADDRHVVLGLTRHHARRASGAGIQVDRHSPRARRRADARPRATATMPPARSPADGAARKSRERHLANERTPFHRMMGLRRSQGLTSSGLLER